jgi:hypothetical protein
MDVMEHVAILKRWYYRSSRVGEIFFADDNGVFPFRRIVRGVSRVYRGEKPDAAAENSGQGTTPEPGAAS